MEKLRNTKITINSFAKIAKLYKILTNRRQQISSGREFGLRNIPQQQDFDLYSNSNSESDSSFLPLYDDIDRSDAISDEVNQMLFEDNQNNLRSMGNPSYTSGQRSVERNQSD